MPNVKIYQPAARILSATDAVSLTNWVSESLEYGAEALLIDMSRVSFMDSRGLGALIITHNRVTKQGGRLGICSLSGQARMLLELTNLGETFEIYGTAREFIDTCDGAAGTVGG
ncbi:MAG: STAS domain-containing protein [Elainellaceae cyanobacterium]